MKEWKPGDKIVFTYPNGGKTYLFTLDCVRDDGYLQFMSKPARSALGNAIHGGLTITKELAQVVWEANEAARRSMSDAAFGVNHTGYLKYVIENGSSEL